MSRAYGIFRASLIRRIMAESLTPNQVADTLESEGLGTQCRDEIIRLRILDDSWSPPIPVGRLYWDSRTAELREWPHSAAMPPSSPDLPVSDSVPTPAPDRPSQGILERSDAWEILA